MSARPFRWLHAALLILCMAGAALAPAAARADSIDDVAGVLDTIDSVVPKGSPDGLPFNGDDLRGYRDLIKACEGSSGADDVIACVDAASSSEAGQQGGIPSWFPQMLDVYFDIEHHDYWGLFKDGGEAVACATGQALTGGVDVCGAIKELIKAAKDVAAAAEAVGEFFADLGTSVGSLGKDIYCLFADCDDEPPPESEAARAYQQFYFPRIPVGLAKRMESKLAWVNYSGEGENLDPLVIDEGLAAPGGFTLAGLKQALPGFIAVVNKEWDAKMIAVAGVVQKAAYGWNAYRAQQSLDAIHASVAAYGDELMFYPWRSGVALGRQQAHDACAQELKSAGGQQVDDWIAAGGPKRLPGGTFAWPDNYVALCKSFDVQLASLLKPETIQRYQQHLNAKCPSTGGGASQDPVVYTCINKALFNECGELMAMKEQAQQQCKYKAPGPTAPYQCKDGYKLKPLPEPPGGYPGCTRIYKLTTPDDNSR